jgi:hypothetical protein
MLCRMYLLKRLDFVSNSTVKYNHMFPLLLRAGLVPCFQDAGGEGSPSGSPGRRRRLSPRHCPALATWQTRSVRTRMMASPRPGAGAAARPASRDPRRCPPSGRTCAGALEHICGRPPRCSSAAARSPSSSGSGRMPPPSRTVSTAA